MPGLMVEKVRTGLVIDRITTFLCSSKSLNLLPFFLVQKIDVQNTIYRGKKSTELHLFSAVCCYVAVPICVI